MTDGRGAHAALVSAASGEAYTLVSLSYCSDMMHVIMLSGRLEARDYLRDRGTLAILGLPPDAELKLPILSTMLRGLRVIGCYVGNRQDAVEALQLHATGRVS